MTEFAILATGPSMTPAIASAHEHCIAVNDAFRLRPDAHALCAADRAWWIANPDALAFKGRRFSTTPPSGKDVECVVTTPLIQRGSNSALLALHVAITKLGATRVLLYGVDMSAENGSHYFGPHRSGLSNTRPERFEVFKKQFAAYAKGLPKGVEVLNATHGSSLQCFPFLN